MSSYIATVSREGKWWMVRVAGLHGLTQARHLGEANQMAREFIAVSLDEPLENIDVVVTVGSAGKVTDIDGALKRIRAERAAGADLERKAQQATIELARALVAEDIPLRDIGSVLGLSHQRVHQLVNS
ncbi:hypothetical protein [Cryobacterium sp. PH31-O1]|uniref:hypothetical protein n=1 Tax=Cryobacterium sp. PH31-O1 TaxID=3046306 RepID=UPI0024B90C49|nr:hypothetical protein [Cryobacterium sp. PH31-O1]MDJ0338346.1 hypothetical protein [Cryobacterium sp. PH31-O1]